MMYKAQFKALDSYLVQLICLCNVEALQHAISKLYTISIAPMIVMSVVADF